MADQGSITQWIADVRAGEGEAATVLWQRYYQQLVVLANKKLRGAPRRVADEEDVVVNAFDSFCRGAEQGRFPKLDDRDDLWQVLVMLTARKAINQRNDERRQVRGGGQVRGESIFAGGDDETRQGIDQIVGSEPSPEFAADVARECETLMNCLEEASLRTIAIQKMEGYTVEEIAAQAGCSKRTVERQLHLIRKKWQREVDP